MQIIKTSIEGLLIIEPTVFGDERGYFLESYNQQRFIEQTGVSLNFVQDNESKSAKNVLRGLHFQVPPKSQAKLVRVLQGSVLDVAVDLRKNSSTYGKYEKVVLSASNKRQFLVPAGFAHGFLTLEDDTIFVYKCSEFYSPEHELSLSWDDPQLNIDWGIENPVVSDKDRNGLDFDSFDSPFSF